MSNLHKDSFQIIGLSGTGDFAYKTNAFANLNSPMDAEGASKEALRLLARDDENEQ